MKKFLLSIITIMYMTVSSGIAMEIHYCMGKEAGVEFYKTSDKKCGRCGMAGKKGGCCHDEHKFYKLSDDHKNVYSDIAFHAPEAIFQQHIFSYEHLLPAQVAVKLPANNSPPDLPTDDLCIRNCVFRI